MRLRTGLRLLCLTLLLAAGTAASAVIQPAAARSGGDPDRLPRFSADIAVQENGDLLVTEEIDFLVTPGSEKRGIFRDLPTAYRTALGLTEWVGYEVLEVTRDDRPEHYVIEWDTTSLRIRVGQETVLLDEGLHRYRITYRTDRQLLFLEDTDELYWNVTGNDWAHPIDQAEARIHLPDGAEAVTVAAYTGRSGETGEDFTQSSTAGGSLLFASTRTLQRREGLTVVVAWPKGFVIEPSYAQRVANSLKDNLGLLVMLAGLISALIYFTWQWHRVGRDPEKGVIVPKFEPPEGLSPAATSYIWGLPRGGFDEVKAFTAALTSLAVKGRLSIDERETFFMLHRKVPADLDSIEETLPRGEVEVLNALLPPGSDSIVVERRYNPVVWEAVRSLSKALQSAYRRKHFRANARVWNVGATLAGFLGLGGLALQGSPTGELDPMIAAFLFGLFALVFAIGMVLLARMFRSWLRQVEIKIPKGWRALLSPFLTVGSALVLIVLLAPVGSVLFVSPTIEFGLLPTVLLVLLFGLSLLFRHLLEAPTPLGREVLDQIEGYRLYLSVAERERLNLLTAEPEMTLESFEHHLPYAMALGVEEEWSSRFLAAARPAVLTQAERQPGWYRSTGFRFQNLTLTNLGPRLSGGLSETLSTATTQPASSSGGGFFSGGGRGGGGGGSW